jgi:hypothetical protein
MAEWKIHLFIFEIFNNIPKERSFKFQACPGPDFMTDERSGHDRKSFRPRKGTNSMIISMFGTA